MTVRNLEHFFTARTIAVVGASPNLDSLGGMVMTNLMASFTGTIFPVNPNYETIHGFRCFAAAKELPFAPDLAIIVTPPDTVTPIVAELGARGCMAVVVITAGFGEGGKADGMSRRAALLAAAEPHVLRIIGPNCFGVMTPAAGINASFSRLAALPGHLAIVAQSGAVAAALVDWARPREIGFSHVVALGDMIDVDFGDMLDYLAADATTHAILLYMEGVTNPRKFMSAARRAARTKPVLVIKSGRTRESAKVAASHTGALAGADAVYDAVFERAGLIRVEDIGDLFATAALLDEAATVVGERLAIITNGGGLSVMAVDKLVKGGGRLAQLSDATLQQLNNVLPPSWSGANPVDILGDASAARYAAAMDTVMQDPGVDAVLVLHCPTAAADPVAVAAAVCAAHRSHDRCTLLTSWVGDASVGTARRALADAEIPTFETPTAAVRAFTDLLRYRDRQRALLRTPPVAMRVPPATVEAAAKIIAAFPQGWLPARDVRALLKLYGVSFNKCQDAGTAAEAAEIAAQWGHSVALKIRSPDIVHKTDVGGVALDVQPADVDAAASAMLADVSVHCPQARVEGFLVEEMVKRPRAQELILGVTSDPTFGPIIAFGQGGTAVEVLDDKALGLPPLDLALAHDMIAATRVGRLLAGYRGQAAADVDGIAAVLVNLSQMIANHPQIMELDINPLLADAHGVLALDARVRVDSAVKTERLIIRPYPQALESTLRTSHGQQIFVWPIRPEDEPRLCDFVQAMSPEDRTARFLHPLYALDHGMAARLCQIDYDRELALVATGTDAPRSPILAVARYHADPDLRVAEFALATRTDQQNCGIGTALLTRLFEIARQRGLKQLWGEVQPQNVRMIQLCEDLGLRRTHSGLDPSVCRLTLDL